MTVSLYGRQRWQTPAVSLTLSTSAFSMSLTTSLESGPAVSAVDCVGLAWSNQNESDTLDSGSRQG